MDILEETICNFLGKMWKKKHDADVERKWEEKEAKKRKQVVDTDYLYGDWMKDKKK